MKKTGAGKRVKSMVRSIAIAVALVLLLWFNRESVRTFIDFARDRQAVVTTIDDLGLVGPLVLMGLIGLQVLIPSLPAEPPMIAAAYIYGLSTGSLMSWLVSVATTQAVFFLARRAGRPVAERFVPAKLLDKWTRMAGEKGALFFLLAFVIPPIPSDIMIYVAGLSAIEGRRFFVANLVGRVPMIILLSLVGANGLKITPDMIVGLTGVGLLMMAAWWTFVVRERPEAGEARAPLQLSRPPLG